MKTCILMGSPRKNGNTSQLLTSFITELEKHGGKQETIWLYDKKIEPCHACRACQTNWEIFGCPYEDDVQEIFDSIMNSDLILVATPIYSWYCTAPVKALLDRLVYGMNKYYGVEKGPSLWAGKKLALLVTCGYKPENGADLFENGMIRYCKHSKLNYMGMQAERDLSHKSAFMDEEKKKHACEFAGKLIGEETEDEAK